MSVNSLMTDRPVAARDTSRHRRRLWQFGLRRLFVLVTVLAVGLGWLSMKAAHARRQRAAVEALGATGFFYDFQRSPKGGSLAWPGFDENAQPPGPAIVRWLWGEHVLANIVAFVSSEPRKELAPGAIHELAALDTLEEADLSGQPIGDDDLDALRALTRIKSLNLSDTLITDAGLQRLSGMTGLEELGVNGTLISGVGLIHLGPCKCLKVLDVSSNQITSNGAKAIGNLTALRSLWATADKSLGTSSRPKKAEPGVGDEILKSCARLQHLEEINLDGRAFTDEGLRHLRGLPRLERIYLEGSEITDEGLAHVATLESLAILDISSTNITDAGLRVLRSLEKLETLKLRHNRITDAGIRELSGLKNLWRLELQGTSITDEIANCVPYFRNLQWCGTDDTGVTPAGRKRIDDELLNLAFK